MLLTLAQLPPNANNCNVLATIKHSTQTPHRHTRTYTHTLTHRPVQLQHTWGNSQTQAFNPNNDNQSSPIIYHAVNLLEHAIVTLLHHMKIINNPFFFGKKQHPIKIFLLKYNFVLIDIFAI